MRRNPEVNAETHRPIAFAIPADGTLPTTVSPTVAIATGEVDNSVYIQTVGIVPYPNEAIPKRRIVKPIAEMNFWRIKDTKGRQDYEVTLFPSFEGDTEEQLLRVYENHGGDMETVNNVYHFTQAKFSPSEGFSLMAGGATVFELHPERGIVIHPQMKRVVGEKPSALFEYTTDFSCSPFDFSCIAGRMELGDYIKLNGERVEGLATEMSYIVSGVQFASSLPEVLDAKLNKLLDKGITNPLQVQEIFKVYTELVDIKPV
jgi:hypothetical protein